MNYKMIGQMLGRVLMTEALLMLLPLIVALCYGESVVPFLLAIAATGLIGCILWRTCRGKSAFYARDGFVVVALSWILMSLFGALPFVLSGDIPHYVDAVFETVSGFTSTGASIMTNVETLSYGCQFWRCFTQWVGGMGVLVFILAILPMSGEYSMHIMRAEVPGPTVGKLVPRARKTALILYQIYVVMTVIEVILLILGGMNVFDALVHSFATAGTGGFSSYAASVGAFDSAYIDCVIGIFMLLFSINFNLYYLLLIGRLRAVARSEELWWFLGIVAFSVVTIALSISRQYDAFGRALRDSFFQVSSMISTTGFATADFNLWTEYARWLLVLVMLLGGCAGSTCGGLKVSRLLILFKFSVGEIRRLLQPRSVSRVRVDGRSLDEKTVHCTFVFFLLYMVSTAVLTLLLSLEGKDLVTNLTAVIACISNSGPGLGDVGPMGNYALFTVWGKLLLVIGMLLGRLEIFPILMLFAPPSRRLRRLRAR